MSRSDKQHAFRAARRHSRFVRVLRVALPVCIVLAVAAGAIIATVLDPLRALAKLPIDIGSMVVSGTTITMQRPRLAGLTQDKRPYVLTARAAAQDATNPQTIELREIEAKTDLREVGEISMSAQLGLFETKAERLTLRDNIVVKTDQYQARLAEAVVNVRTTHIVSEKPVEVTMPQGSLTANRLEITNSGGIIRFDRGVTMLITSIGDRKEATAEAK
jgi:lipopolysaccharide export system protein LptC